MKTKVVPAYGLRPIGGFGVRGHRAHCDCGYLSGLGSYRNATERAYQHRKLHEDKPS